VKSVDVEPAIRGNLVDLDDRTQFAAQLDEIESRVDLENYRGKIEISYCWRKNWLKFYFKTRYLDRDQITVDQRIPAEGRERFLKARVTVLEEEVNKLQKELQRTSDKLHKAKREAQSNGESTEFLTKQNEKLKKDLTKSKNGKNQFRLVFL